MKSIVTALVDPSGAADYRPDGGSFVEIWSTLPVGSGGTIATDKPLRVDITASGLSTPPIRPGNYQVRIKLGTSRTALGPYPFTMPDGDGTTELWPLIQAAVGIPPDTPIQKIQEALAAYLLANPIEEAGLTVEQIAAAATTSTPLKTALDNSYAPVSLADEVDLKAANTVVQKIDSTGTATPAQFAVRLDANGDVDALVLNGVDL